MSTVTGWFPYRGTTTHQHSEVGNKLKQLFEATNPSQVLEIGTANGGLTILIRDLLDEVNLNSTPLRSYDINPDHSRYEMNKAIEEGANIDFRLKNIFNHPYSELVEVDEIAEFIQRPGRTIVMCDGGSKKNEFRILAPLLKAGDIIMAHDYAPNPEYFSEFIDGKIWNWLEIQDEDINEVVNTYNLQPYMQEVMQEVVWVCKIKN